MAEYIDKKVLIDKTQLFEFYDEVLEEVVSFKYIDIEDVNSIPTVNVVPVEMGNKCMRLDKTMHCCFDGVKCGGRL